MIFPYKTVKKPIKTDDFAAILSILNSSSEVSMDFMANGLLALGAHPAIVHSVEELDVAPWDQTMGHWKETPWESWWHSNYG